MLDSPQKSSAGNGKWLVNVQVAFKKKVKQQQQKLTADDELMMSHSGGVAFSGGVGDSGGVICSEVSSKSRTKA